MKTLLLFKDREFSLRDAVPSNSEDLMQDLELGTLLRAMAGGDEFIYDISKAVLLTSAKAETSETQYRQWVMQDCLTNASIVKGIYDLAVDTLAREREATFFSFYKDSPSLLLHRAVDVLRIFADTLQKLRHMADASELTFRSDGFQTLFKTLQSELTDDFFEEITAHLRKLKFSQGLLMSARLGDGNKGSDHILSEPPEDKRIWPLTLIPMRHSGYTLNLHPRDEAGAQALAELRNRGLALTARAVAQSVDHILHFFQTLRTELAFYIGAINLYQKLRELGTTITVPRLRCKQMCCFQTKGLFDVCLALSLGRSIVGNDFNGDSKHLIVITGANQGGKSTFLRSVGLAQLMAQSGLFVGAEKLETNSVDGIFTHYRREEDSSMASGKFDEELKRMDRLTKTLRRDSMILFNESFASTNEREGSEVAAQIVRALVENEIKVFFVTHLYRFAHAMADMEWQEALFLRAERLDDGGRTFRLLEGEPKETSFGKDLYLKVFGDDRSVDARLSPLSAN